MKSHVVVLLLLSASATVCDAQPRIWTDGTGKYSVEAELVEVEDGQVHLRKAGGQVIIVPLERLSAADQEHVRQEAAQPRGPQANTQPPAEFRATTTALEAPKNHGGFFSFAFSPDGKTVAGGTGIVTRTQSGRTSTRGGEVLLWDADTGKLLRTLGTHEATVWWVQYSADGRRLVSISQDNWLLKLWDTATGEAVTTLNLGQPISKSPTVRPLLSTDGGTLVAGRGIEESVPVKKGAKVGSLKVGEVTRFKLRELTAWDLGTGKTRWSTDATTLRATAMSTDGKAVALSTVIGRFGEGGGAVAFHDALTGKQLQTLPLDFKQGHSANLLAFIPGGGHLAGAGGGKVWVFDPATKSVRLGWDMKASVTLKFLAFSPDGRSALTCDFMAEQVQLWDVSSGRELARHAMTSATKIWHPTVSSDLTRIACQQMGQPVLLHLRRDNR
jgi:WD40 repeat protein